MPPTVAVRKQPRDSAPRFFAGLKTRDYREHRNASNAIKSIAWNHIGNRIACGLSDRLVRVWNPEKPEVRYSTELKGHTGTVDKVVWDPTHTDRLASAGSDAIVRFWDYRSAKCFSQIPTGGENISLSYSPDGNYAVAGTKDDMIVFIDCRQNQVLKTHKENVQTNQIIWSHSGDVLMVTTSSGLVKLREWPSLDLIHTIDAHTSACYCLELDPRGEFLAVGGSDAIVSLWDIKDWTCTKTFAKMEGPVRSLGFSFDGSYICAGSDEPVDIEIAHVETGDYVHTIPTSHPVQSLAWHPSRYWLAYSGDAVGLKILGAAGGA